MGAASRSFARWILPWVGLGLAALGGGCSRTDPHVASIEAANPQRLRSWKENVADQFKPDEWREFEAALQELRLRVMADRQASGSAAVEEAMCTRVHGRTFNEVIALGCEAKLARLDPLRAELKRALDANALLVTKPGDTGSANYLDGLRERQEDRVRKLDAEIEETEKRLVELDRATWSEKVARRKRDRSGPVSPPALSREAARVEITHFINEQRAAVLMKYGDWPAKIETEGSMLPEPERSDFGARRAAAAASGNTVVAVRVRDRWWIYDDRPEMPTFSRSVMANLSELDRLNLRATWANWQAELWARRRADEENQK